MTSIAFMPPVRGSDPLKCQMGRNGALTDRKGQSQNPIAIGDIGTDCIHWYRESKFTVIAPNTPFIHEEFLDLLEQAAQLAVEN